MNARKATDYRTMFNALDTLMAEQLSQMELYCEISRLVSIRPEKGAAVAASEYLCYTYPDISGFSPRNLRRMRKFCQTYEKTPAILTEAMTIGWTQNVVIQEAGLAMQEKVWYIRAVQRFGWSKLTLQQKLKECAHLGVALDFVEEVCYTEENHTDMERTNDDKHSFRVPWQDVRNPPKPLKINGFGTRLFSTLPTFYQQQRANRYNTPKHPLRRLNPSWWVLLYPLPKS